MTNMPARQQNMPKRPFQERWFGEGEEQIKMTKLCAKLFELEYFSLIWTEKSLAFFKYRMFLENM